MSWADGKMLSFDVESTGTDVFADRIVTATIVTITPGQDGTETRIASTVINPGVEVPDGAAAIHGYTTARVQAEGKPPAQELDWLAADLCLAVLAGTPIVIANAPYDLTILNAELRRHGLPTLEERLDGKPLGPIIDPMCIDKRVDKYRKGGRKLENLCETYGVRLDGAHDATFDALAAARVVWRIAKAHKEIGDMTAGHLHRQQIHWYAEQSKGLAQFWRRKANQLEHEAYTATTPEPTGEDADQVMAEAGAKAEEAAELRERADGVTCDWPIRAFPTDTQIELIEEAA